LVVQVATGEIMHLALSPLHFAHLARAESSLRKRSSARSGSSVIKPDRQGCCCWQGTYESFGGEHLKVNVQPEPCRRVRGMFRAKERPEQSDGEQTAIQNQRHAMRLLFLPVLTAAIVIGGETVALPQVEVRVEGPRVVFPQVVVPQVVYPQVVAPFPVYGDYYERRRDVYSYGQRGHESRERAHHDDHRDNDHQDRGERH
jgi:hypothetical protein